MEIGSTDVLTMSSFLDRVIQALTENDAPRLRDLLRMTDRVEVPRPEHEVLQVISRRLLLSALLKETGYNLRLLHRVHESRATSGQARQRF